MAEEKEIILDDIVEESKKPWYKKVGEKFKDFGEVCKDNAEEIITAVTFVAGLAAPFALVAWANHESEKEAARMEEAKQKAYSDPDFWRNRIDEVELCDLNNKQVREEAERKLKELLNKED